MTGPTTEHHARRAAEHAARASYGRLVAILALRDRDLAGAEDALSDALVAALEVWPARGVPENPEAWLITAARNRLNNAGRARRVRELAQGDLALYQPVANPQVPGSEPIADQRLRLMFVCAHPAIDVAARAPLMLQAVLGFSAEAIARAFLVEPSAMSQRLVRAKARIRHTGLRFDLPSAGDMPDRLSAVLDAIYAAFGQGWEGWENPDTPEALTGEAIWLARLLASHLPAEPEAKGLLALMLYCSSRSRARRTVGGDFVPLDQQDTRLWDRSRIIEAEDLLTAAAGSRRFGRYQCEAAIQSVHVQRRLTGRPGKGALLALYDLLVAETGSIGARIARAVVLAEEGDPAAGLRALDDLEPARVTSHQPYWVARGTVLDLAGQTAGALAALDQARALTWDPALLAHLDLRRGNLASRIL